MKTYKIVVNVVNAAGSTTRKALRVSPKRLEVELPSASGEVEHALVTWTFRHLPAGVTPVITFDSQEVIAAGPTTTSGANPQVTFEIRYPPTEQPGDTPYLATYRISASSHLTKALPLPEMDEPSLVVVTSPDPPGGAKIRSRHSHATM
ncbi:MAG: hypothetical protein ACJ76Y_08360 [Thermoanaerobaculia bacterium]